MENELFQSCQTRTVTVKKPVKVKSFGEDGLEHEVKLADKLRALDLLGKHLGMYKDASEKENAAAQNNDMQTLADLLQRPVPNRDIKDFEE